MEKTQNAALDEMLADLRALVRVPSVTDSEAVGEALETALAQCKALGFRTKQYGSFLGIAEIGTGSEIIAILTHLDVVPADGNWTHPPFDLTLSEGKVFGRGVLDNKGGVICSIYAMKDLLKSGIPLNKRIRLIFGTHEEEGDWADMDFYRAHEELPVCGFTPDSVFPVVYAEKGLARFNIVITAPALISGFQKLYGGEQINIVPDTAGCVLANGVSVTATGKAAHASQPHLGVNAITKLMEMLQTQRESPALAEWYLSRFAPSDGSGIGINFSSPAGGNTTINVGKIELKNGAVTLQVDVRFCADRCFCDVEKALLEKLNAPGIQVQRRIFAEPVFLPPNSPEIQTMRVAYCSVTGDQTTMPLLEASSTYASAMPHIAAFGPLLPGRANTAHKVDEYILAEDLVTARKIYFEALKGMLCIDRGER